MPKVYSFPPTAREDARVLLLGTMPGKASLLAQQYYAHPRNAFWSILAAILGFDAADSYAARLSSLSAAGIALWDVLQSCSREGSLDANIDRQSIVINDFVAFLAQHPQIRRICFNGAQAEALFRRHVRPTLASPAHLEFIRLPSTSPAHAALDFSGKLATWKSILR